jgi:hypothetical protein
MVFSTHRPFFASLVLAFTPAQSENFLSQCPDVQPLPQLNLTEYTRASWYVQEQQVNSYQNEEQLQCVVATYDAGNSSFWDSPVFYDGQLLSVYNYYDGGRPTLDGDGKPTGRLCASLPESSESSKLAVAPCFLPTFFGGKYWVIGVGTSASGEYEWAIISGGPPMNHYADGCTTGTGYFDSGLWIFSRTPVLPEDKLTKAKELLVQLGYTLSLLKKVRQSDCSYEGAYIKPSA